MAIDPSQLENLTKADLKALHDKEETRQRMEKRAYNQTQEDMSDLVSEHAALQAKKRKTQEEKKSKKYKF